MKTANAKELNEQYKDCPTAITRARKTLMKLYTGTPTIRQWTKFFTPEKRYRTKEKITPEALDSSGKLCYNECKSIHYSSS